MCPFSACKSRVLFDGLLVVLVCLLAAGVGYYRLFVEPARYLLEYPCGIDNYLQFSAMIATGRGFVSPVESSTGGVDFRDAPELGRFLRRESPQLRLEDLPADLRTSPASGWAQYHRYLFYTIGWLWRAFGISWSVVKAFRIGLFCVMMAAIFGLFRLGMGRFWSLAGAVMVAVSAGMFTYSADVRDYSKGAFVLMAMFLLGCLAKWPVKASRYLTLASLLGLIVGVGIGFRADVFASLPAAVLVLAFCARPTEPGLRSRWVFRMGERLAALGVLTGFFLVSGWLILAAYHTGRLSAHDFIKGLATAYDDLAGVGRCSYEHIYRNSDVFVGHTFDSYSARMLPSHEPDPDMNARREACAWGMARTVPGDMLARAYTSVLWVLRGGMLQWRRNTPMDFGRGVMAACAAAVLLLIAQRNVRLACMSLGLLMYFCGYLSFQAAPRHGFHLGFVPVWVAGFLLDKVTCAIRRVVTPSGPGRSLLGDVRSSGWTSLKRMAAFAGMAPLLLLTPLYGARALQHYEIGELLSEYVRAELEPVPLESHALGDWVLFRRTAHEPAHSGTIDRPNLECNDEYWVAEFACRDTLRPICLHYDCQLGPNDDFSLGLWVPACRAGDTGVTKYFFPVYEKTDFTKGGWGLFAGLAVPQDQQEDFKGLYRVRNADRFRLFLNLALPPDLAAFRDHQEVYGITPPEPVQGEEEAVWLSRDPELQVRGVNDIEHLPAPDEAAGRFKAALETDAGNPVLRLGLATAVDAKGDPVAALEAYRQALAANPRFYVTYHYLDAFFMRKGGLEGRVAQWRAAAQAYPDNWLPCFHLALALEEKQDLDGALDAYRRAVALNPSDAQTWNDVARLLLAKGDLNSAEGAYERALETDPYNPRALRDLADLRMKRSH